MSVTALYLGVLIMIQFRDSEASFHSEQIRCQRSLAPSVAVPLLRIRVLSRNGETSEYDRLHPASMSHLPLVIWCLDTAAGAMWKSHVAVCKGEVRLCNMTRCLLMVGVKQRSAMSGEEDVFRYERFPSGYSQQSKPIRRLPL